MGMCSKRRDAIKNVKISRQSSSQRMFQIVTGMRLISRV